MKRRKVLFFHLSHIRLMVKKFAIVLLFLIAFAMMLFNKTDSALIDKTSSVANDVLSPLIDVLVIPARIASSVYDYFYDFSNIREENKKLKEENRQLVIKSNWAETLAVENKLLSNLLNYTPPAAATFVTARVIAEEGDVFSHSLIAYTGGNKNVKKGQVVLSDAGVVGRIDSVGAMYSKIILITDINSKIPVMIEKNRTRGILSGDNTSVPKLIFTPLEAELAIGDKIVTSGVAGVFPAGLPIGKIISLDKNNIKVKTFSDLDRIEYIKIVDYSPAGVLQDDGVGEAGDE